MFFVIYLTLLCLLSDDKVYFVVLGDLKPAIKTLSSYLVLIIRHLPVKNI